MTADFWEAMFEHLKNPNRPALFTVLTANILLALSPSLREALGLEDFYSRFDYVFAMLSLYSFVFLCYDCVIILWRRIKLFNTDRHQKTAILRTLQNLPRNEQQLLSYYFAQPCDVVWLPVEDPTVISLLDKHLLHQAHNVSALKRRKANISEFDQCWACAMPPAVRQLIKQNFQAVLTLPVSASNLRLWEYDQEAY